MKLLVTTGIAVMSFVSAFGQAGNSSLAGTYKLHLPCTGCDSIVKTLKLESKPGNQSGTFSITMAGYLDSVKDVRHRYNGKWFALENEGDAKSENVRIIVLDILGRLETYPLFLVQSDGNLRELKQQNPERFPEAVVKKEGRVYVAKKGGHMLALDKATRYRDNPFYHIYTKKK